MAVGVIMQFSGVGSKDYDRIMQAMGMTDPGNASQWPKAAVSHTAGATATGWVVVDVWESRADFDRFAAELLMPKAAAAGINLPPPTITEFQVHNAYRRGR